jgi:hypothetical protein
MKTKYSFRIVLFGVIAILALLATVVVAAQAPEGWPFSSDPGYTDESNPGAAAPAAGMSPDQEGYNGPLPAASEGVSEPSGFIEEAAPAPVQAGPQPDENGYDGPLYVADFGLAESSGANEGEAPNWEMMVDPNQPDVNAALAPAASEWSGFYYILAAGSTLRTRNSAQDWANSTDGGCVYAVDTPGEVMNLHLDLPTGSRIDYLRIFYFDTSASDSQAWVTTYNGAGGLTDVLYVTSAGNAGYGTALSNYVGHVVDNANNAYVLNWRPNVIGSTMRLCGLRVAYRLP